MYSDTDDDDDDRYFDDFEKDIFNEISRRALIRNKIISRSQSAQQLLPSKMENAPISFTKNSATQTSMAKEAKRMQSTSKIVIKRQTQGNKTEKREVIIQTNIDHDGKVCRTTEIRNSKQNMIKIENECFPPLMMNNDKQEQQQQQQQPQQRRRLQTNDENSTFPRTQSAFDLMTDNDDAMITGKTDDDFLSNKAFSSLDIRSSSTPKSPVASEGYHSERLDHTPSQYVIEPPESFRKTDNNIWVMNNETLVENIGQETNITTKASTTRKPAANEC
ncbi:hypothetical protein BLA29_008551, partial [Euroglyphus maynei]